MPSGNRTRALPLLPLLTAFRRQNGTAPSAPSRTRLEAAFLGTAPDDQLASALESFAAESLPVVFHSGVWTRRVRFVRHALNHLFRSTDPLPERVARCVAPGEVYFVPGLGPGFWSAMLASADPERTHVWCPAVETGLSRLGLISDIPSDVRSRFDAVLRACDAIREQAPDLTAADVATFLECVSRVSGRELPTAGGPHAFAWAATPARIEQAVREVRSRSPLRARIRATTDAQAAAVGAFQTAANDDDHLTAFAAFRAGFPDSRWEAALPALDDAYSATLPDDERGRLWCEVATVLRERFRVHPLELADVVCAVVEGATELPHDGFGGFCSDTFAFLAELTEANEKDWMAEHRDRYQFVLREPLVELCESVAERYVRPVLNREYGWDLECDGRTGRAVTSICKNDFGRSGPYQPVQWITFYRKAQANKRADSQFFVRVAADRVSYGFHLGRTARRGKAVPPQHPGSRGRDLPRAARRRRVPRMPLLDDRRPRDRSRGEKCRRPARVGRSQDHRGR